MVFTYLRGQFRLPGDDDPVAGKASAAQAPPEDAGAVRDLFQKIDSAEPDERQRRFPDGIVNPGGAEQSGNRQAPGPKTGNDQGDNDQRRGIVADQVVAEVVGQAAEGPQTSGEKGFETDRESAANKTGLDERGVGNQQTGRRQKRPPSRKRSRQAEHQYCCQ